MAQVKVVLQDNVQHLGQSGDIVRVRPGYARNYLIPRGLAVPATAGNLARVDELKRLAAQREKAELAAAEELKTQLESVSVKIVRTVGDGNKMYGSVTAKDIEEAYREVGVEVDRKKMRLDEPIRHLGLSEVSVRLHSEVTASLRVEVIKPT